MGKDVEGDKKITIALSKVKGVGYNFAQVLLQKLNINPYIRVGLLTDKELTDIENALKDPGSNIHLLTSDLDFIVSNDIDREKSIMSWRGYRHMFGLRVRGQRTRTTCRRASAVGVRKTAQAPPKTQKSGE